MSADPPPDVRAAIETALAALEASPDGTLALSSRRQLRVVMGPWTSPDAPGGPDAGLLRRAELQVACARRALCRWEDLRPRDHRPRELLDAVLPGLRGERAEAEVDGLAATLSDDVAALVGGSDDEPRTQAAYFSGLAALQSWWFGWDGDLDPAFYPPEERDEDLDEPRAEFLAATALAPGDPQALRSFWRWYATEAFPAAYLSAS